MKRLGWVSVSVSVSLLGAYAAVGCGGDSEGSNGGTGGAPGGGAGNTPTSAGGAGPTGAGGTAGPGAGGSAVGMGGAAMAAPVACGSKMCTAPPPLLPGLPGPTACCVDPAAGTCGTSSPLAGGMCSPPPVPDPDCDSISMMGFTAVGCCAPGGNNCGIDGSMFGAGCIDLSNPMFARLAMGAITLKHCDGTVIPQGTGGMMGAGGGGGAAGSGGGAAGAAGASGAAGTAGASGGGGRGGTSGSAGAAGSAGTGGGGGRGGTGGGI